MYFTCSSDLQKAMKVQLKPASDSDPKYLWYAQTFRLNRKNCVVIMHPETWFSLVLWGVKAKDYAALPKKLPDYIRQLLKSYSISDDVIDAYLADCGEVTLAKNSSRRDTARLNQISMDLKYYCDTDAEMDDTKLLQIRCSKNLNKAFRGKDYKCPYNSFVNFLRNAYSLPLYKANMYHLKITLDFPDFEISRVVRIPENTTFRILHRIIQNCFNWQDEHLYEFSLLSNTGKVRKLILPKTQDDFGDDWEHSVPTMYDTDCTVGEIFSQTKKVRYVYDMGDNWEHEITLLKTSQEMEDVKPTCLEVTGKAPPEDCGGIYGYQELLSGDPEMVDWAKSMDWEEQTAEGISCSLRNFV